MHWRSITDNLRELGWSNGLLYLLDRLMRSWSRERFRIFRYLIVAQPVALRSSGVRRPSTVTSVRQVEPTDAVAANFPRSEDVIAQRFRSGAVCLVSEVKGNFAGYAWFAFGGYDEDEVRCRYNLAEPRKCAWDFDVYVAPAYRLGRTFGRLWDAANHFLNDRGVQWSFSRISMFNAGSLAAHRRLGFEELHTATFICLGRVQVSIFGSEPYVHVGWKDAMRPVLLLGIPKTK